jgi:hypothetical protein
MSFARRRITAGRRLEAIHRAHDVAVREFQPAASQPNYNWQGLIAREQSLELGRLPHIAGVDGLQELMEMVIGTAAVFSSTIGNLRPLPKKPAKKTFFHNL